MDLNVGSTTPSAQLFGGQIKANHTELAIQYKDRVVLKQNQASLAHSAIHGLGWQYISSFTQALLQLAVFAVLSRLLAPQDFGLVSLVLVFVGFTGLLSQLGVGPAIIHRTNLTDDYIRVAFTLAVSMSVFMAISVWYLAPLIGQFLRTEDVVAALRYLSLSFVFSGLRAVPEALLTRKLQFKSLMIAQLISYIFGYAFVGIALAWLRFGVWSLVAATLAQNLLNSGLLIAMQRHPTKPSFALSELREIFSFGGGVTLSVIFNYMANQGDYFIVGRVLGIGALGIYARAYQLMMIPSAYIGQAIQNVSFPTFARLQDTPSRLSRAYLTTVMAVALIGLPASALMVVIAPELIGILLGAQWGDAVVPFQVLSIGTFFRMAYKQDHALTKALGAVYKRSIVDGVYAGTVFVAALFGTRWGLAGVAYGVLIAIILNYVLTVSLSVRLLGINWTEILKPYIAGILVSFAIASIAFSVRTVLLANHAPSLAVLAFSGLSYLVLPVILLSVPPSWLGPHYIYLIHTILRVLHQQAFFRRISRQQMAKIVKEWEDASKRFIL